MDGSIGRIAVENIRHLVSQSAPLLGTILGTPLAGIGLSLLGSVFGVDSTDSTRLIAAIKNDPETVIKLKTLEYNHAEEFARIAAQNYQTEVDDRKSARERDIATRDKIPTFLSIGFLLIYCVIQIYCIVNPGQQDDIISARLQDILVIIVSYYFGSSHRDKPPQ